MRVFLSLSLSLTLIYLFFGHQTLDANKTLLKLLKRHKPIRFKVLVSKETDREGKRKKEQEREKLPALIFRR